MCTYYYMLNKDRNYSEVLTITGLETDIFQHLSCSMVKRREKPASRDLNNPHADINMNMLQTGRLHMRRFGR